MTQIVLGQRRCHRHFSCCVRYNQSQRQSIFTNRSIRIACHTNIWGKRGKMRSRHRICYCNTFFWRFFLYKQHFEAGLSFKCISSSRKYWMAAISLKKNLAADGCVCGRCGFCPWVFSSIENNTQGKKLETMVYTISLELWKSETSISLDSYVVRLYHAVRQSVINAWIMNGRTARRWERFHRKYKTLVTWSINNL